MSFPPTSQDNERVFNNADSFGMAFDAAWKNLKIEKEDKATNQSEKMRLVFEILKNHPFLKESPLQAEEVAKFRIRLLNLV